MEEACSRIKSYYSLQLECELQLEVEAASRQASVHRPSHALEPARPSMPWNPQSRPGASEPQGCSVPVATAELPITS